ncbi:MAG: FAD-dependent monooxygenase [Planctomycetota bacterium]|nr:FAD-dependent monooxygenase [Planctomycetota bacterium]
MTAHTKDVAVVGGGPAGAAAALAAARGGAHVMLFEPRRDIDKPCGEGVLAGGVEALEELGVSVAGHPFRELCYVLRGGGELRLPLDPPGLAVARPELSGALTRGLSRAGVTVRARAVRVERAEGAFLLKDGKESRRARTVIACDGAHGRTAAWLGRSHGRTRRHGIRARMRALQPFAGVEVHLGGAYELYLTPLSKTLVNVAVLGHGRPRSGALAEALRAHPRAAEKLGEIVTPPRAQALSGARPSRSSAGGAFLAGDACGAVDPILGCGVTIALRSGRFAGASALRYLAGENPVRIERDYRRFLARELRLRRALAAALAGMAPHPGLLAPLAAIGRRAPGLLAPLVSIATGANGRRPFVHAPTGSR